MLQNTNNISSSTHPYLGHSKHSNSCHKIFFTCHHGLFHRSTVFFCARESNGFVKDSECKVATSVTYNTLKRPPTNWSEQLDINTDF